MKKFFLLLLLFFPITVKAEVKVTTHLIDSEIEIAGGLRVKELIIFDGNISDFSRTINYKMIDEIWDKKTINLKSSAMYNGYSLENIQVALLEAPKEISFENIPKDLEYINELDPQKKNKDFYTNIKNNLGSTVNIHYEGKEEKTALVLEYLVSNVIVSHEDINELNYTFKNLDLGANHTFIRVIIPYATDSDEFHYWVHGPSNGKLQELVSSSQNKIGVVTEFSNLKSDINVRMTIPKDQIAIDIYLNKSKVKALNDILKIEDTRLKKQSNNTTMLIIIKYILIALSSLYVLGSFVLIKYHDKSIFILYLILGIILSSFNIVFKYHIIYLYFLIIVPLTIKLITKKRSK